MEFFWRATFPRHLLPGSHPVAENMLRKVGKFLSRHFAIRNRRVAGRLFQRCRQQAILERGRWFRHRVQRELHRLLALRFRCDVISANNRRWRNRSHQHTEQYRFANIVNQL
jgi:hypothetical protein